MAEEDEDGGREELAPGAYEYGDDPNEMTHTRDWFLEALVRSVNESGLRVSITLVVGGAVITGNVSPGKDYFADFLDQFSQVFQPDTGRHDFTNIQKDQLLELRRQFDALSLMQQTPTAEGERELAIRFIHLRDAQVTDPDGNRLPTRALPWWRGRLAAVDGWSLGRLMTIVEDCREKGRRTPPVLECRVGGGGLSVSPADRGRPRSRCSS